MIKGGQWPPFFVLNFIEICRVNKIIPTESGGAEEP